MKAWKVVNAKEAVLEDMGVSPVGQSCVKLKMLNSCLGVYERMVFEGKVHLPLIIGREGVGMVTEVGEGVTGVKRGDRVYIQPVSACGSCGDCLGGKRDACEHSYIYGKTEDGVLRDFMVVPEDDLYVLPPKVSPEEGVFIENVAAAVHTADVLGLEKGEHVVITSATVTGMIFAQVALYYQAIPILVDMRKERLDIAERLGIYYTVNPVDTDPVKKIFTITGGRMAEKLVNPLPAGMPLQRSFDCLVPGGSAAFVGVESTGKSISLDYLPIFEKNITCYSVGGSGESIPSAINMLASKAVDVKPFISKHIKFSETGDFLKEIYSDPDKYIYLVVDIGDSL